MEYVHLTMKVYAWLAVCFVFNAPLYSISSESYCGLKEIARNVKRAAYKLETHDGFTAYLIYNWNREKVQGQLIVEGVEFPLTGEFSGKGINLHLNVPQSDFQINLKFTSESTARFKIAFALQGKKITLHGEGQRAKPDEILDYIKNGETGLWLVKSPFYMVPLKMAFSGRHIFAVMLTSNNILKREYWLGIKEAPQGKFLLMNAECANCRDGGMGIEGHFTSAGHFAGRVKRITFSGTQPCEKVEAEKIKRAWIPFDLSGKWNLTSKDGTKLTLILNRRSPILYQGWVEGMQKKGDVFGIAGPDGTFSLFFNGREVYSGRFNEPLQQEVKVFHLPFFLCTEKVKEEGTLSRAGVRFCGWSTQKPCKNDSDCSVAGCSGEVCAGKDEQIVTTCLWKECYDRKKYPAACRCIDGRCRWKTEK